MTERDLDRGRQHALDAAEHIIKMIRDGYAESDCLSEGADVIMEAVEHINGEIAEEK